MTTNKIKSLPYDKILTLIKLKGFADDKFTIAEMTISVFDKKENIVGKGENAGHQHFLLFPQCFQKGDKSIKEMCLTLYQTTIFRLVQIQSTCRQQNKCDCKIEICFGKGRNIVEQELRRAAHIHPKGLVSEMS